MTTALRLRRIHARGALPIGVLLPGLLAVACGSAAPAPTKIPAVTVPQATISAGLPAGLPPSPTGPNGQTGPSPVFMLTLNQYTPGDSFVLDFEPPDAGNFVLHDPTFCGASTTQACRSGGTYGKGPFLGMQLVGTSGHYRYIRVTAGGTQTVFAEGDVDLTQWRTVSAQYPTGR